MSSRSNQLKDGILNQIAEQIKGLQISQHKAFSEGTSNFQVTINNIHLQCLLDLLDHILLHGLQRVDCGYWPFVKEFTHSDTVERISNHHQVSNDLDKGRAWIFTAFSDGLLESYVRLFVDSQKLAKKFYTKSAFVRDKERLVVLQTLAAGLDFITLDLNQDDLYLGYGMSPFQESVVQEPSLPSPITARRDASIYSLSLGDEDIDQSTASSFSNSSTMTDPLSPKSCSTDGSQDTILEDVVVAPDLDVLHSSKNGVDFSHSKPEVEATDMPEACEMSITSVHNYPAGSNDSLHSSLSSTDSFDQFCKESDSSLNFTSEVSVDSPTLHICNNEGPLNLSNENKEAGDAIENSGQCPLNLLESSEYDGIILGLPKRPSLKEIPVTSCDISLDQNTILTLSLEVFWKNDEQLNRIVVFMSSYISGQLSPILVLLTDHAVYLLRKVPSREGTNFFVERAFPFVTLKKVEVGLNYQTLTIASKSQKYSLFVADEAVTRDFLSSMTSMIVKSGHGSLVSSIVSTSGIQQETRIKRWLRELDGAQDIYQTCISRPSSTNITCFSLVYWYGLSGPDAKIEVLSYKSVKEGFLDCKQQQYLGMGSRWMTSYFVLMNGTLYQYVKQGDKASRVVAQLRGSKSGGCRRIDDADRQFAFEIVSEDGSPLVVLAAPTEADASDWIFKLCQSVAEMFESQEEMGCTVMSLVPCCLTVTNDKIVTFLSHIRNEDTFQLLSSCCIQNITRFFVDNDVRNYCILKFQHSDITSSEASWFIWFKTEYELSKFEGAVANAWQELFKIDLQFLVLGEGSMRKLARARAQSIEQLYRYK